LKLLGMLGVDFLFSPRLGFTGLHRLFRHGMNPKNHSRSGRR
jgi:hypothetical protein